MEYLTFDKGVTFSQEKINENFNLFSVETWEKRVGEEWIS